MTSVRARGMADLITLLPYQLGYHPTDSVVVVAVKDGRLGLIARVDLPPEEHACEAAQGTVAPVLDSVPDSVLLVAFESRPGESTLLLDLMVAQCDHEGCRVDEVVVVRDGRWWSRLCDADCCPEAGRPVPDPSTTPGVAEFVSLGVAPLADRSALTAVLAPDERAVAGTRSALEEVARDPADRRAEEVQAWSLLCDLGEDAVTVDQLGDRDVALLVAGLREVHWRDALIARMCPDTLADDDLPGGASTAASRAIRSRPWDDPDSREAVIAAHRLGARLLAVARRLPAEESAPYLTVLATFTWWCGDGARTRAALERALSLEPDYRLARLLATMVDHAVRTRSVQQ